jgi:hydrogenase-4 component F
MLLLAILLVPLIAGAICAGVRSRRVLEGLNLISGCCQCLLAAVLVATVLQQGPLTALHDALRADALSVLVVGLTAFVGLVTSIYAVGYMRHDERIRKITRTQTHRFYTLTPLLTFAMLLVALANNLGVMWIAIEGTTLVSVLLVAFYNERTSLEAAWKYIIIGSVGIALALFGTVMTYFAASSVLGPDSGRGLNWSLLVTVADRFDPAAMRLGFILALVGYGVKAGLVPMHTWKPDAYAEAPAPSAALLGAAFINCALYAIIRFTILAEKSLGHAFTANLLLAFGLASILIAAPFVVAQRNFRRILAYSSIDHAGIMVAALGFGGKLGALGAMLHMLFHGVTKPLMFFCAGSVQQQFATPYFWKVRGVMHILPWTGGIFLMATLALTGTPPFSMFQSEFTILSAALAGDRGWLAALFLVGVVTIFAGFLVHMSRLILGTPAHAGTTGRAAECPWKLGAIALVALPVVTLGFWLPRPLYELVLQTANIIGGAQ